MKSRYLIAALMISVALHAQQGKIEMHGKEPAANVQTYYGKVLEVIPAPPYKYLRVDEAGKEIWVAISSAPVEVGDKIGYDKNTVMKNFKSKTLGREFKEIIFAFKVNLPDKRSAGSVFADTQSSNRETKGTKTTDKKFIQKDTYTIEELFASAQKLHGKTVSVTGNVTKVSRGIMGKDWVHIEDGTGSKADKTNDLTVTAPSASVEAGDSVTVTGKVVADKDLGAGYYYKVLLEEASFSKR